MKGTEWFLLSNYEHSQGAYNSAEICFLFEKYESLMSKIYKQFSFKTRFEECGFIYFFMKLNVLQLLGRVK